MRLPDLLFCYRVASDSMVRSKEKWQKVEMFRRIFLRHQQLFSDNIGVWLDNLVDVSDRYFSSRLYVDCGQGISDASSVVRKVDGGTRLIVFDLSEYQEIAALRFDPVDTWAVLEIGTITVEYLDQSTRRIEEITSNALYQEGELLFFDSADPQCFFPNLGPAAFRGLRLVTIELRFEALAESALQRLVVYQKALLEKVQATALPSRRGGLGGALLGRLVRRKG